MIKNPILRGFNPDPCICRKGEDYYIAVSSFEWFPAVPVYHSKDLKNWELLTHILTDEGRLNLSRLRTGQGIWAPCLSYCEQEDLFYLVYGCMVPEGMNIDNYLITAKDITGPFSEPVYLHSSGFDASLFHDDDGRKWLLSLEWERREGYYKPGAICIAEYSAKEKRLLAYPERIWYGATKRGWVEGPHMYKHDGKYYLLCAEGGTGYHHCACVGRSDCVRGPFEGDSQNPVITSVLDKEEEVRTRAEEDYKFYNPEIWLQKAGHASLVMTPGGKWYAVHLCGRPLLPERRCILGRETAIEAMEWTKDGWIRKKNGLPFPEDECEESGLAEVPMPRIPERDDFDEPELGIGYYAPRHMPDTFADVKARKGYVRLRGQEVLDSFDRVSVLARKLTSVHMVMTVKMEFEPEVYQHTAGIVLYYDNLNYLYLRKYYSETLRQGALSIVHACQGTVEELTQTRMPVSEEAVLLRLIIDGHDTYFEWSYGKEWRRIGGVFDTSCFSDEFCGEFTGTMAGIACTDGVFRRKYADFDYFELADTEECQGGGTENDN
ncbi:MAG: glycoside hydrolase family 43 protein [Lachnospiraceae bacterium]|nr:glycoside hydrolase family 43 protein [Lachnospiraceae bacterium]